MFSVYALPWVLLCIVLDWLVVILDEMFGFAQCDGSAISSGSIL